MNIQGAEWNMQQWKIPINATKKESNMFGYCMEVTTKPNGTKHIFIQCMLDQPEWNIKNETCEKKNGPVFLFSALMNNEKKELHGILICIEGSFVLHCIRIASLYIWI